MKSKKMFFVIIVLIFSAISFFIIKDNFKKEEPKKEKRDWAAEISMNMPRKKPIQRDVYMDLDGNPFYLDDVPVSTKSKPVTDTVKKYHAVYSKPYVVKKTERKYLSLDELQDSMMMAENNKVNEKRENKSTAGIADANSSSNCEIIFWVVMIFVVLFYGARELWSETKRKKEY